jgi:predicted nucleic acid-binding protein
MRDYRLTAYDATYVELAKQRGFPLATFDKEMREAASQHCIPLANKV